MKCVGVGWRGEFAKRAVEHLFGDVACNCNFFVCYKSMCFLRWVMVLSL